MILSIFFQREILNVSVVVSVKVKQLLVSGYEQAEIFLDAYISTPFPKVLNSSYLKS